MAWPCITRACCINRFWTELDKADIAVPLVFTKYSDVADVHHLPQRRQPRRAAESQPEVAKAPPASTEPPAASGEDASAASVTRQDFQAWKVRPEPSCKPRNEYQPSAASFIPETQYQKDYKAWPIPKKRDHPWIPKADLAPAGGAGKVESETGVEKSEIEEKLQEKEVKEPARRDKSRERKEVEEAQVCADVQQKKKGRAVADALNRHIKETMTTSSSYRTEFKAYKDVKPVKPIKATSQYKPPAERTSLETSYSATYRGEQGKAQAADNKLMERRRIRSLYSEPGKEPAKTDKPASRTRPKKKATTTSGKAAKKAKEKQLAGSASAKKKEAAAVASSEPPGDGGVSKKSKEISNRLAEAKQ